MMLYLICCKAFYIVYKYYATLQTNFNYRLSLLSVVVSLPGIDNSYVYTLAVYTSIHIEVILCLKFLCFFLCQNKNISLSLSQNQFNLFFRVNTSFIQLIIPLNSVPTKLPNVSQEYNLVVLM